MRKDGIRASCPCGVDVGSVEFIDRPRGLPCWIESSSQEVRLRISDLQGSTIAASAATAAIRSHCLAVRVSPGVPEFLDYASRAGLVRVVQSCLSGCHLSEGTARTGQAIAEPPDTLPLTSQRDTNFSSAGANSRARISASVRPDRLATQSLFAIRGQTNIRRNVRTC